MSQVTVPEEQVRLGYRSLFTVDRQQEPAVVATVLAQLNAWLRHKKYDVDALEEDQQVTIGDGVTASMYRMEEFDGAVAVQVEVNEERPQNGTWKSELLVHAPGRQDEPATVLLDISGPWKPRAPHLARNLTGTLPAHDSMAELSDRPRIIDLEDVDDVADAVCDPHRRGLLFVAGSSTELPFEQWYQYVVDLLKETTGLAAAYVLDPHATEELQRVLGESHGVDPGTVRTYLPGADPASKSDALRHRILTTNRIVSDSSYRLASLLGKRAQEQALRSELPRRITRLQRRLGDHIDQLLLPPDVESVGTEGSLAPTDEAPERPAVGPAAVLPEDEQGPNRLQWVAQRAASVVRRVLGVDEPQEDHWERVTELALVGQRASERRDKMERQLAELRDELESAEFRRGEIHRRLEDEKLEHAETAQEIDKLRQRNSYLEGLLRRTELVDELYADVGEQSSEAPGDFEALISRTEDLEGVVFTGDADVTLELDQQDPMGRWAGKSWEVLCALADYARAKQEGRCSTNMAGYLQVPPDGCRGYSANKHASTESEDVQSNRKFRQARLFPVPSEVSDDQQVEMFAHFKIAQSGLISPRLHYYDDTARTGKIYVGYIGPHLPTKQTN